MQGYDDPTTPATTRHRRSASVPHVPLRAREQSQQSGPSTDIKLALSPPDAPANVAVSARQEGRGGKLSSFLLSKSVRRLDNSPECGEANTPETRKHFRSVSDVPMGEQDEILCGVSYRQLMNSEAERDSCSKWKAFLGSKSVKRLDSTPANGGTNAPARPTHFRSASVPRVPSESRAERDASPKQEGRGGKISTFLSKCSKSVRRLEHSAVSMPTESQEQLTHAGLLLDDGSPAERDASPEHKSVRKIEVPVSPGPKTISFRQLLRKNDGGKAELDGTPQSAPVSPEKGNRSLVDKIRSVGKSPDGYGTLSLATASGFGSSYSYVDNSPVRQVEAAALSLSTPVPTIPNLPLDSYCLTSSELEPSSFQVDVPSKHDMIVYSKIILFMTDHTSINSNYDFDELEGVPLPLLKQQYMTLHGNEHRTMVLNLTKVGVKDIIIQSFVRNFGGIDQRIETVVASSENLRQIVVCTNVVGDQWTKKLNAKDAPIALLPDHEHPVRIHAAHHSAYFGAAFEEELFYQIEKAVASLPFFDVVFTGYGFGAAMATIAGSRYASRTPQLRVSCHVFGSPKVGDDSFRRFVHSLPNLRVFRVEGQDAGASQPPGSLWLPVGHAVRMRAAADGIEFEARRFDRPATSTHHKVKRFSTRQGDTEISCYVQRLSESDRWFEEFCDLEGRGVVVDKENRNLA